MMKIVLFALVCVSVSQVYGAGIEDEIKEAIKKVDTMNNISNFMIQYFRGVCNDIRDNINTKTDVYCKKQNEFQKDIIALLKNSSAEYIKIAKNNKAPEKVIKCISNEEEAAVKAIGERTSKFQVDIKKLKSLKLIIQAQHDKELTKCNETRAELYKKSIADLKKCKDSESVQNVLERTDLEFLEFLPVITDIDYRLSENNRNFENELNLLLINANSAVIVSKNVGLNKMRNCLKTSKINFI